MSCLVGHAGCSISRALVTFCEKNEKDVNALLFFRIQVWVQNHISHHLPFLNANEYRDLKIYYDL